MTWLLAVLAILAAWVLYDLFQRNHTILRNFPIIGHFRYWLEAIGPELRQYIVTSDDDERPFTRDQRSWVYASAKRDNNLAGFGTDNAVELAPNYLVMRHSAFPLPMPAPGSEEHEAGYPLASAKVLGGWRGRRHAFRPRSVINISALSYGSLSWAAIQALNEGAELCGCLHNTGEGGISPYHRRGGELIYQIGTGYFGCRTPDGDFSMERLQDTLQRSPTVRAIEIKLSQGAKPGHGGILPARKVTPEIAEIRGVREGEDVISPSHHRAFSDVDGMIDFVEEIAEATGLPVGFKSAVGQTDFWDTLVERMEVRGEGPDFVSIDGGEGGTGAAPLSFADYVALPFKQGFASVYRSFAERGITDRVVFVGAGRLGFPEQSMLAFAMGCDLIAVAREAMLAIGCIQAKRCHTDHCPTGVATHNKWLVRGLVPERKSHRLANYVVTLRKEILELTRACGVHHPAEIGLEHFEILDDRFGSRSPREVFGYEPGWGRVSSATAGPPA